MRRLSQVLVPPPNGSRLSCGRLARRRKGSGRQSVPARAQHSASLKTITARQLQAHVRLRAYGAYRERPMVVSLEVRSARTA